MLELIMGFRVMIVQAQQIQKYQAGPIRKKILVDIYNSRDLLVRDSKNYIVINTNSGSSDQTDRNDYDKF